MKKIKILLIGLLLIMPAFALAEDLDYRPMYFSGRAELNGNPLPVGSKIQAYIGSELIGGTLVDDKGYSGLPVGRYSGSEVTFKYIANNTPGNYPVTYVGYFEPGKSMNIDLSFSSFPVYVSHYYYGSTTPETVLGQEVLGVKITATSTIYDEVIAEEAALVTSVDSKLSAKLKGYILLQVENKGQAWYVDPVTLRKYYLVDGKEAYRMMRLLGIGITDNDLERIKNDENFAAKHAGKIFLQVEQHGEAWYINPNDKKAYYMKDGAAAYQIMRNLSLGITNDNLRKIAVGDVTQ